MKRESGWEAMKGEGERERERERFKYLTLLSIYLPPSTSMTNKSASDAVINEVRKSLKHSRYNFTSDQQARIISGEEEAVGGWTTANYLTRHLNPPVSV